MIGRKTTAVFFVIALGLSFVACSDFEKNAYKTMAATQAEFQILQSRTAEATAHGIVSEDQWNRFSVEAHVFINIHSAAVDAFEVWHMTKNKNDKARLEALLGQLQPLVDKLKDLAASFEGSKSLL